MRGFLQGVLWVTGVYFYFLIFAQFSFLEILDGRGFEAGSLKLVMGAMALGGIAGSILVLPLRSRFSWAVIMRVAAGFCALMPVLAVAGSSSLGVFAYAGIAMGIGLGLGVLTVLLAANLNKIMNHVYLGAGLGTGLAYMFSNLPWVFQSSPEVRCYVTAGAILLLALIPLKSVEGKALKRKVQSLNLFPVGVICFTMLVWLDSAAFYIIQHNEEMKLETWGESHLWRNAMVHLLVAVLSGWLLLRGRMILVLASAFALLGVAGLMASEESLRSVAGYLYPAGVSLYSVALILYPAVWLGQKGATLRAVVLFAVAGWVGSAMGIGMAQDLNGVPGIFVVVAGLVMISPLVYSQIKHRKRELAVCGLIAVSCLLWFFANKKTQTNSSSDPISLGREVYISEGCIHCHSRYVRPNSEDVLLWGPKGDSAKVTSEKPVIIGNRRQGPDLLHVGLRRSKAWMRQHFIDPQSLDANSSMPSYAHLFKDDRGEALVEYLAVFESENLAKRQTTIYQWLPSSKTSPKSAVRGDSLFSTYCASCHGEQGRGDGVLAGLWVKPPANLIDGPFAFTSVDDGGVMLARVIKFGIPGTDMPGHELLSDADVKTLVDHVRLLRKK
jgi:cytochrome c oxidase cbb3-type subunit 2